MNRALPVIIDCDPGVDDIFALYLARQDERLDVRAITTVAGNVPLAHTAENALRVAAYLDWDVPVARGAAGPLCCRLVTAEEVHGVNGMQGLTLPETSRAFDPDPAWDVIYREAKRAGKATLIATGPFTNVALCFAMHPDAGEYIERIVVMGGSFFAGNTTPAAEFNVFVDPEAAERMFACGVPVVVCPLDVTHKAYITAPEIDALAALGEKTRFLADVNRRSQAAVQLYTGGRGVPLHDPCAVMYAADPTLFCGDECSVVVETQGSITRGKTVTDLYSDKKLGLANALLVHDVDRERFIGEIMRLLKKYNS